jgi:hypothetical protein
VYSVLWIDFLWEHEKRKLSLLQSRIETTVSVLHLLISAMEKVTARGAVSDGRKRGGKMGKMFR